MSTLCMLSMTIHAQRGARIAYIDMDVILSKNKEFITANRLLDEKTSQWKKEIELKKIKDSAAIGEIVLKIKNEIKIPLSTIKGW